MRIGGIILTLAAITAALLVQTELRAQPCLIFVHGKRTHTLTYTNWGFARDYWKTIHPDLRIETDFIRTATRNFQTRYYVVGYNGTNPWWGDQAAGEVAAEIVNATNGGADGGGNRCGRSWAQGGEFWVIAHSMGGTIMDFILGNSFASDPNYNFNGRYDLVGERVSVVVTVGGAHRGSQAADAVCSPPTSSLCSFIAGFIQSCDTATYWLRSSDDVQVRSYSEWPSSPVWLFGGFETISAAGLCLSGEDDGAVQYASAFACGSFATLSYNNSNVCGNSFKQESANFYNLDGAHENHDNQRNASHIDERRTIPDGYWFCGSSRCPPNTLIHVESTAQSVAFLY